MTENATQERDADSESLDAASDEELDASALAAFAPELRDEPGLVGVLAASRRRLIIGAIAGLLVAVAYAAAIGDYVNESSASVAVNLGLVSAFFFVCLLAGWVQAMLVGDIVWGTQWRELVLLRKRVDPFADDIDIAAAATKDHTFPFYGLAVVCGLITYIASMAVTGDFVGEYQDQGYFLTLSRSDAAEERVRAARQLASPFNRESAASPQTRRAIADLVADEEPEVAAWAAWSAGKLIVVEAQPNLLALLDRDDREPKVQAAHALGRIADPAGERAMIERLPETIGDDELLLAYVRGLGFAKAYNAAPTLASLLGVVPQDVEIVVLWALGQTQNLRVFDDLASRIRSAQQPIRCAAADALKYLADEPRAEEIRTLFETVEPSERCERKVWIDRSFDDDEPAAPLEYVMGETIRLKLLKAAYNARGPGIEEWLNDVAYAPDEPTEIKAFAYNLLETLQHSR